MNKVVITVCSECSCHCPADSYGAGTFCDELMEKLHDTICDLPIPDKCPKISQNGNENKSDNNESDAIALITHIYNHANKWDGYNIIKGSIVYGELEKIAQRAHVS